MKQIEFETRLAELQAEYLEKKSSIELAINDLKVAILNHQSSLSAMKADLESRRAALFVEFEKTGGQEQQA